MKINFWETESGRAPVYRFLEKQPPDAFARIIKDLEHLAKQGLNLLINPNKLKAITGHKNLYELRTNFKGVFYRIIFCVKEGNAYLLEAFKKKNNHTRLSYINNALKRQKVIEEQLT